MRSQDAETTHPRFRTRNVALTRDLLSIDECGALIRAMEEAPREPAQVVRAGESILDQSLRFCFDHHLPDDTKRFVGERLTSYFDDHRPEFDSDADYLYGPYFMSYEKGSYFRAHRDVANHKDDPPRLAAHRWSLLLYLNGRDPGGPLPAFDGGALTLYETDPDLSDRRVVIVPEPGMLVLFRASLMHEVATVLDGTRYAVAGWMSSSNSLSSGGRP
ncbi:2OG-Fe(II) oxygenase [Streptomyces sp. NPDC006197]|uniref:2OG-Fe(II) oxygenase n=1 Tax=Streptomyces sp. NPDC006197 TaxID=3156685 RepID=UPI0033A5D71D